MRNFDAVRSGIVTQLNQLPLECAAWILPVGVVLETVHRKRWTESRIARARIILRSWSLTVIRICKHVHWLCVNIVDDGSSCPWSWSKVSTRWLLRAGYVTRSTEWKDACDVFRSNKGTFCLHSIAFFARVSKNGRWWPRNKTDWRFPGPNRTNVYFYFCVLKQAETELSCEQSLRMSVTAETNLPARELSALRSVDSRWLPVFYDLLAFGLDGKSDALLSVCFLPNKQWFMK